MTSKEVVAELKKRIMEMMELDELPEEVDLQEKADTICDYTRRLNHLIDDARGAGLEVEVDEMYGNIIIQVSKVLSKTGDLSF